MTSIQFTTTSSRSLTIYTVQNSPSLTESDPNTLTSQNVINKYNYYYNYVLRSYNYYIIIYQRVQYDSLCKGGMERSYNYK